MKRALIAAALLLAVGTATAVAQDIPSVDVTVGEEPYTLPLKADELGILYLDEVTVTNDGQFANAIMWVQTRDGEFVQVVPCDGLAITCERIPVRVEGAFQGQSYVLREWTGPQSAPSIEEAKDGS